VLIQSHCDRHQELLKLHGLNTCADYPRFSRGDPARAIFA
jgi:hypothetical protein